MTAFGELTGWLDEQYPPASAAAWDRVGVVCGEPDRSLGSVLLTVDVTPAVVAQARELGASAIVAHHPLLLRGVHGIDPRHPKGRMVTDLVQWRIGLYCAHTNADIGPYGTVAALADRLGLREPRPLVPSGDDPASGLGRVGTVEPTTVGDFAALVADRLPRTAVGVRVAGDPDRAVTTVAVQAGAGDDLFDEARRSGADLYLTSDLRHHPASEALCWPESPALLDVAHWAAEWTWLPVLQQRMADGLGSVPTVVSDLNTDPWTSRVG
ncbi:Nif3-like dinuclear metal center hexameric protein [Propionibacteriaceae bacterium Y2011]